MKKDENGFFPIKILFIGVSNVGKTSIIKRLINREDYKIDILHDYTIDLDIYLKTFKIEGQLIKYELYDTPGIIGAMNDNLDYIKLCNIIIFVFDLSSKSSFLDMKLYFDKYKEQNKKLNLKNDAIIIGNKLDKKIREINFEEINNFSIENNIEFFEMSAIGDKIEYNKLINFFENLGKNILFKNKIIIKDNFFDKIRFRYISKRDENYVKPSLIYKQIDIFVKTLSNIFDVEEYIIQIINNINDFYKIHVFKKVLIKTFNELKNIIYNLEILKSQLIDIFRLVSLKYDIIIKYTEKNDNKKRTKNDPKIITILNTKKNIKEFINSNSILRKAIQYCIHDYIINFIFDFNNEILLYKRLNMIIKEDNKEENFNFKYFSNFKIIKKRMLYLFNDNYVKYLSSNELHQYYLFIRNIEHLFRYLSDLINENNINIYFSKGENNYNILQEYIDINNKKWEKIKNQNLKNLDIYEIEKNIKYYSKKSLKYYKYILIKYDSDYKDNKNIINIFNCIKIRLYLSLFYFSLNKKYEYVFFFYSSFLLITEYIKNLKKENENNINEEKEIFELFNKIKEKIFDNSLCFENFEDEKTNKEMKKKLKYILNNSIEFLLLINQEKEELKLDNKPKIGMNTKKISNEKYYLDFFSFPNIILNINKSLLDNKNEKMKIKIKLYEIYLDSLTYFKRGTFKPFFQCLSQNFSKKESLIKYDGNNFLSMKIEAAHIENILLKNDFLPSEIAQLFNIIGIALMLLFRKNEINKEEKIKLYKKHRDLALILFNAGLNDTLIQKTKELDNNIDILLNINLNENNHRYSLEQIRNCIKYNISILLLIKDKIKVNNLLESINNDFPLNYSLENIQDLYNIFYFNNNNNNNINNENILTELPNIKNYFPLYKDNNENEYLNYFLDINKYDEFYIINALLLYNNKKDKIELITPSNFKEIFINNYNNNISSVSENNDLFNEILSKENLNNIEYWKKKFDNKQGKGFLFNPIYFYYINKYYNIIINIFTFQENSDFLKLTKTINQIKDERNNNNTDNNNINIYLICDKNITQTYQIFIPLINKNEIYNNNFNNNINKYIINISKRIEEYKNIIPEFTNFLLWTKMNTIKILFINEKILNEINEEIIDIYFNTMLQLGLYEQIIDVIENNFDTFLKSNKKYYIILYKSYKKLCLYDNCIEIIKKYLYLNNSTKKILNYDTIEGINKLIQKDFNYIYTYYKNLEKERPIIFTPPLLDEDSLRILKEKYKNADDNIFNLEAQICEEKIIQNQKMKNEQLLEKEKDGNKFRVLLIEGGGIRSLIQILYLCEIENFLQKPISQAFDCIATSKDGIFICGLLATLNEKREIKYHANDILKIFNNQKETIYNTTLKKELKINTLKNLFNTTEILGNFFYFDEKNDSMLKIGTNDLIFDLFENYIDIINKKEKNISFNNILRIIPVNVKKENIWLMDIGSGIYKFNNKKENEHFLLNKILKEQYLNLDIPLNTCKDQGKYSFQNLDNKFNEILSNCIEYFSEIKENNTLNEKLNKFFNTTNINTNITINE